MMRPLSASEAVWPAMQRTHRNLFQTFKSSTFLKLASVAVLTEGVAISFKFTLNDPSPGDSESMNLSSIAHVPGFAFFAVLAALAVIVLGLLLFYAITRLRFAFFHCLVHQTAGIRAGLTLYRAQAERFCVANILVWLAFLVLAVVVLLGFAFVGFAVLQVRTPDGKLDPGVFFILFVPALGFAALVFLAALIAEVVLHDFILPHVALENLSFRESWAVVRARILADKETFFSYFILRLLLPLIAGAILAGVAATTLFIVFSVLGMSATGFNSMLEDATGFGAYIRIAINLFFVGLGISIGAVVAVSLGGPVATWIRNYALLFYGGHYSALGNLLDSPVQPRPDGA